MMMVVADAVLEACRRPGWLYAPDETSGDQDREGVVYRLERDGSDICPDEFEDAVGGDVWLCSDGPQYGQSLRGYLDTALPEKFSWVGAHRSSLLQVVE
jgi:hypothetical protein